MTSFWLWLKIILLGLGSLVCALRAVWLQLEIREERERVRRNRFRP